MSFIVSFKFIPTEMMDLNKIASLMGKDDYLISDAQEKQLKEVMAIFMPSRD